MNGCNNFFFYPAAGPVSCFGYTQVTWKLYKDGNVYDTKTQNFYGFFSNGTTDVEFVKPAVENSDTVVKSTWMGSQTYSNIKVTVTGAGPVAISKINGSTATMINVNHTGPIILTGSASTCATSYFVSVQLTDAGGINRYNHEAMMWLGSYSYFY